MIPTDHETATSRRLGELEGTSFDAALRQRERDEVEERLAALAADPEAQAALSPLTRAPAALWRLQRDLDRYLSFYNSVINSRAWRFVQAVRRPFGRTW